MNGSANGKLKQLPEEMFSVIKSSPRALEPRLGRLALPGRQLIETPHYLGNTSRGVVPHITQDTFRRDTHISGVYYALEDFLERSPLEGPPLYQYRSPNGESPLRKFTALPDDTLLVLGARRTDAIVAPAANSNTSHAVSICTSVGFQQLKASSYAEAAERLGVDIEVGLADIPYGRQQGKNRVRKAEDRSMQWFEDHIAARRKSATGKAKLFASLLPLPCARQVSLLELIREELDDNVSGLAIYNMDTMNDLPESLMHLPRLDFSVPQTPLEVLQHIRRGMDVFTIPFIGAVTDAGIAMDFTFPAKDRPVSNGTGYASPLSLGVDMWDATHAVDLSPLSQGCKCYACTNHHRAYIQHLLSAKEMLGWVLLQIHNHHIMDLFFAGIRASIAQDAFNEELLRFEKVYERRLPEKTGQGPRLRGYQFRSEGPGEPKKNRAPFTILNDKQEKLAEAILPSGDVSAQDLKANGFAGKK